MAAAAGHSTRRSPRRSGYGGGADPGAAGRQPSRERLQESPKLGDVPTAGGRAARLEQRNRKRYSRILSYLDEADASSSQELAAGQVQMRSPRLTRSALMAHNGAALSQGLPSPRAAAAAVPPPLHPAAAGAGGGALNDSIEPDQSVDAESMFCGIRQRMERLREERSEAAALNEHLRGQLEAAQRREEQRVAQLREAAQRQLQLQKDDLEAVIQRNMQFINTLLADKEALAAKVEELGKAAASAEERHQTALRRAQEDQVANVSQLKGQWQLQEKKKREQWMAAEAKKIKDQTLKALEPDITLLVNRHKAEKRRIEEERDELLRRKEQQLAEKDRDLIAARAQHHSQVEDVLMKERESVHQRLSEQAARLEGQMEEQRKVHAREKELLQRSAEDERAGHLRDLRAAELRASEAREREQEALRRLREELDAERAKLRREKDQEVEELRRRAAEERAQEVEAIRARLAGDSEFQLKKLEDEMRDRLKQERDAEVARVVERLEEDALRQTLQARQLERQLHDRAQAAERERDRIACELATAEDSLRTARQTLALREADRDGVAQELLRVKEQHNHDLGVMRDERAQQLHDLDAQWQQRTARRQEAYEAEKCQMRGEIEALQRQISCMRREHEDALEEMREQQGDKLEEVTARVQQTLARKEQELGALREALARSEARNQQYETLLKRHHDLTR